MHAKRILIIHLQKEVKNAYKHVQVYMFINISLNILVTIMHLLPSQMGIISMTGTLA